MYFPEENAAGSNIVADIVEECTCVLVVLVVEVQIFHVAGRGSFLGFKCCLAGDFEQYILFCSA